MRLRYLWFIPIWFVACAFAMSATWFLSAWILGNTAPLWHFLWGPMNPADPPMFFGYALGRGLSVFLSTVLIFTLYNEVMWWIDDQVDRIFSSRGAWKWQIWRK